MLEGLWFFWVFVGFYSVHELLEAILSILNMRHSRRYARQIPASFVESISVEEHEKSISYLISQARLSLITQVAGVIIIWTCIVFGVFGKLESVLLSVFQLGTLSFSVIYCVIVSLGIWLIHLPVTLYSQFVIEERYGFNKMTAGTFMMDILRSFFLACILGVPLLYLIFWILAVSGNFWWIWSVIALFGFQFFIAAVYPTLLAPIFNKFIPLPDGSLKERIWELAQRIAFKMSGVFTIDGSRRSSHSNAYFAGMGKMRRIVLFDTLLEQINEDEIVAVLAHEMGHNKKRHIQKQLVLGLITTSLGFWALSLIIDWSPFYIVFGAGQAAPHKALVLFALFAGHFTFFLTPLSNYLSRKYEYEADRFSADVTQAPQDLMTGLVKMAKENLSNLNPHPLYSFYHYSHPTVSERIEALYTHPHRKP
jgi:STE24 endopeptidase